MHKQAHFWNRIARKYAAASIADMAGYEATLKRVRAYLAAHHSVLEVGCGTGTTALHLAPAVARMRATDISEEMVAIACEKLRMQPVSQLSFAVGDVVSSTEVAETYDRVLAFNVLHLLGDLDRALAGIAHVLSPGGLFISKTPCIQEMNPLIRWVALPLMKFFGRAPDVQCFDEHWLCMALTRHGFHLVAVERHGTRGKDFRVFIVACKPRLSQPSVAVPEAI